jgi:hypothetical protein
VVGGNLWNWRDRFIWANMVGQRQTRGIVQEPTAILMPRNEHTVGPERSSAATACSVVMTFVGRFSMTSSRMAISTNVAVLEPMDEVSTVLFEMTYLVNTNTW